MPSSQYYHISKILSLVVYLKPNSVLDVGVGFGKYGVLCREYLELWDGRGNYSDFIRRIDGIEVFPNYITPLHEYVYSRLYRGDVMKLINKIDLGYALVLLIDVLEHFDKEQGKKLVASILQENRGVIISTPKKVSPQKKVFNNEYEIHRSQWTRDELSALGESYFLRDSVSYIGYLSSNKDQVNALRTEFLKRRIRQIPVIRNLIGTSSRLLYKSRVMSRK